MQATWGQQTLSTKMLVRGDPCLGAFRPSCEGLLYGYLLPVFVTKCAKTCQVQHTDIRKHGLLSHAQ